MSASSQEALQSACSFQSRPGWLVVRAFANLLHGRHAAQAVTLILASSALTVLHTGHKQACNAGGREEFTRLNASRASCWRVRFGPASMNTRIRAGTSQWILRTSVGKRANRFLDNCAQLSGRSATKLTQSGVFPRHVLLVAPCSRGVLCAGTKEPLIIIIFSETWVLLPRPLV